MYKPEDFTQYLKPFKQVGKKIPTYFCQGKNKVIFFCIHGAGLSAASFALLSQHVKDFGSIASYDMKAHGSHECKEEQPNYSL